MVRLVLLKLIESYFRHRWLYLLPVVAMIAACAAFLSTRPITYTSSGILYVEKQSLLASLTGSPSDGDWWVSASQQTISELTELMSTKSFARSVIQRTSLEARMSGGPEAVEETYEELRQILWSRSLGDKLVEIGGNSEDPQLAQEVVNATLEAYVQWKINTDYQESIVAQGFFANLIQPYEQEVERARGELLEFIEAYPEPVRGDRPLEEQIELNRLQAQLDQAESRLETTRTNEESARLSQAQSESITKQTYLIIDMPEPPKEPRVSRRELAQTILIFLAIGAGLSLGAVSLGAVFDRTIRFPVDARHGLSLPVLAVVPSAGSATKARQRRAAKNKAAATPPIGELQPQVYAARNSDQS
jgi:uncharacterized protein involved in exopolysaccharide biosynthesis